jgi:hypothetical protein
MNAHSIDIIPVADAATLKRFILLPDRLYRDDPSYVPQLHSERQDALTAKGNPFFGHADVAMWLARRDGVDIGRVSAQQDHLAAPGPHGTIGNFGMLVAVDEAAVFEILIATAETWLRNRGIFHVQGPFNLSINEESGLLIDGFDTPPMMLMPHDAAYAQARVEALGYKKIRDLYAYICDTTAALPAPAAAMVARGLPSNVVIRRMRLKNLKTDIAALVSIFNDGWSGHWGFVPITEAEVDHMAKAMRPLLHEDLVWFAEVDGEPAAFGLCVPNLNEAIKDLSGRLLPFGWIKLLWRLKISKMATARVPLMGVRKKYGQGMLGRLLALHVVENMRREAAARGIKAVEMSWVLEDNLPMRHLAEAIGGHSYKTYRVYEKMLAV